MEVEGERTFDLDLKDVRALSRTMESKVVRERSVASGSHQGTGGPDVVRQAPDYYPGGDAAPAVPDPVAPAKKRKKSAGVDFFQVRWIKGAVAGATRATFRLEYTAKFKKGPRYDPALAEFRQSVMDSFIITAGPHAGQSDPIEPMHDDGYTRADDSAGNAITDVNFFSADNPGLSPLHADDVIDYSFTAEQTIIDTSEANKVIAKRGPHTATIKGKHPRTFDGVPIILS